MNDQNDAVKSPKLHKIQLTPHTGRMLRLTPQGSGAHGTHKGAVAKTKHNKTARQFAHTRIRQPTDPEKQGQSVTLEHTSPAVGGVKKLQGEPPFPRK